MITTDGFKPYARGLSRLAELCFVRGRFEEYKDYMEKFIELAQKLGQKVWEAGINSSFGYRLQKN